MRLNLIKEKSDYIIDKKIPLPSHRNPSLKNGRYAKAYRYPFELMEVGDSFKFSDCISAADSDVKMRVVGNAARNWARYKGLKRKFAVRKWNSQVRVWRIT